MNKSEAGRKGAEVQHELYGNDTAVKARGVFLSRFNTPEERSAHFRSLARKRWASVRAPLVEAGGAAE